MVRHLIIDIETYIYKAMTACKTLVQPDTRKPIYVEGYNLEKGRDFIQEQLNRICNTLGTRSYELVVGDTNNFRKNLYDTYKANRPAKPDIYYKLYDYLNNIYGFARLTNLEGDDTCRIMYEDTNYHPGDEKIIVSVDKDFYSVPCKFYRDLPSNKDQEIVETNRNDALKHLALQIIMGDKTDGYHGIQGYGEVKANKWIEEQQFISGGELLQLFKNNGIDPKEYVMNKVCASIVNINQYNFQTGEVDLLKGDL